MAEEVLVKEVLTAEEIQAGEELLRRLDEADAQVIAAYWIFNPEVGEWHLELVSPQVRSKGPIEFYRKVNDLLYSEPRLPSWFGLSLINILSPSYSFYKELSASVGRKKALSGVHLNRHLVGGQLVDLYIYRLPAKSVK